MSIPLGHGVIGGNDKARVTLEIVSFYEGSPGSFSDVGAGEVLVCAKGLCNDTGDTRLRATRGVCLVRKT
jgi:hypothetical protein